MGKALQDVHLFVLAHPDDEIAFAPILSRLVRERRPVRLIYLTDGAAAGPVAAIRASESLEALRSLGIARSGACFAGGDAGIPDGRLYRHLDRALATLEDWAGSWSSVANVYSLAWEGGHPDHDAALVVAAAFASARGLVDRVRQVPFYRASHRLPPPLFAFHSSLPENGAVTTHALNRSERHLSVAMLRFYPSQWRSFVGLGPLMLWNSLMRSRFELQPLDVKRLFERPTARPLLYEYRYGLAFEEFAAAIAPFLDRHLKHGERTSTGLKRAGNA